MKARYRACGGRVGELRAAQLPASHAPTGLLRPVRQVDQAGNHRQAAGPAGRPAGDVGLEQGGVQQVRASLGGQPPHPPEPADAATAAVQAPQLGAGLAQLLLQPRPRLQIGDVEQDVARGQVRRERDQGAFGAPRSQAVNDVENVHGAHDARRPPVVGG
jgi:hypothetical protein